MATSIKHRKVSSVPDNGVAGQVQPSDWNDDHEVILSPMLAALEGLNPSSNTLAYINNAGNAALAAVGAIGLSLLAATNIADARAAIGAAPIESPTFTGQMKIPAGSVGAPSMAFAGDPDTGIFSPGADQIGLAAGGGAGLVVSSSQTRFHSTRVRGPGQVFLHNLGSPGAFDWDIGNADLYIGGALSFWGPYGALNAATFYGLTYDGGSDARWEFQGHDSIATYGGFHAFYGPDGYYTWSITSNFGANGAPATVVERMRLLRTGVLSLPAVVASSSPLNGTLVVGGGAGIGGALNVGGGAKFGGTIQSAADVSSYGLLAGRYSSSFQGAAINTHGGATFLDLQVEGLPALRVSPVAAILRGAGRYFNFNSTEGAAGIGLRENEGVIEVRNNGGSWAAISAAVVPAFTAAYTSPDQTMVLAGALTLAHGLGGKPELVQLRLKCTTADIGYPRLQKAMEIDETAALKAASWGLGQILGENHRLAGYPTPQAMVNAFAEDEAAHLEGMVRFIIAKGLDVHIRNHNWASFARGYNGASYKTNKYDTKLAAAYAKWAKIPDTPYEPTAKPLPLLGQRPTLHGTSSPDIEAVQRTLIDLGYFEVGDPDGKWGGKTAAGIAAFMNDRRLDGPPVITEDLKAELAKATMEHRAEVWKRPIAEARERATAKDLAPTVPAVKETFRSRLVAQIGTVSTGLAAFVGVLRSAFDDVREQLEPITDVIGAVPWWVYAALAMGTGLYIWSSQRKAEQSVVDLKREGRLA